MSLVEYPPSAACKQPKVILDGTRSVPSHRRALRARLLYFRKGSDFLELLTPRRAGYCHATQGDGRNKSGLQATLSARLPAGGWGGRFLGLALQPGHKTRERLQQEREQDRGHDVGLSHAK